MHRRLDKKRQYDIMMGMKTKQHGREGGPAGVTPHLQVTVREAQRYVYVRWAWRVKVDARRSGKVRGTGRSRMQFRCRYIGVESAVVALLLRSRERKGRSEQ